MRNHVRARISNNQRGRDRMRNYLCPEREREREPGRERERVTTSEKLRETVTTLDTIQTY